MTEGKPVTWRSGGSRVTLAKWTEEEAQAWAPERTNHEPNIEEVTGDASEASRNPD